MNAIARPALNRSGIINSCIALTGLIEKGLGSELVNFMADLGQRVIGGTGECVIHRLNASVLDRAIRKLHPINKYSAKYEDHLKLFIPSAEAFPEGVDRFTWCAEDYENSQLGDIECGVRPAMELAVGTYAEPGTSFATQHCSGSKTFSLSWTVTDRVGANGMPIAVCDEVTGFRAKEDIPEYLKILSEKLDITPSEIGEYIIDTDKPRLMEYEIKDGDEPTGSPNTRDILMVTGVSLPHTDVLTQYAGRFNGAPAKCWTIDDNDQYINACRVGGGRASLGYANEWDYCDAGSAAFGVVPVFTYDTKLTDLQKGQHLLINGASFTVYEKGILMADEPVASLKSTSNLQENIHRALIKTMMQDSIEPEAAIAVCEKQIDEIKTEMSHAYQFIEETSSTGRITHFQSLISGIQERLMPAQSIDNNEIYRYDDDGEAR